VVVDFEFALAAEAADNIDFPAHLGHRDLGAGRRHRGAAGHAAAVSTAAASSAPAKVLHLDIFVSSRPGQTGHCAGPWRRAVLAGIGLQTLPKRCEIAQRLNGGARLAHSLGRTIKLAQRIGEAAGHGEDVAGLIFQNDH
jgi:hypothetical protein